MKMFKQTLVVLVLFASLFVGLAASTAQAEVKDIGDICFVLEFGLGAPPVPFSVGVLFYGSGKSEHFALDGVIGGDPAHGTAVISGDKLTVTLNSSHVSSDSTFSSFSVTHLTVDLPTLQGTFTTMTTQTSPPPAQSGAISGTTRLTPCQ